MTTEWNTVLQTPSANRGSYNTMDDGNDANGELTRRSIQTISLGTSSDEGDEFNNALTRVAIERFIYDGISKSLNWCGIIIGGYFLERIIIRSVDKQSHKDITNEPYDIAALIVFSNLSYFVSGMYKRKPFYLNHDPLYFIFYLIGLQYDLVFSSLYPVDFTLTTNSINNTWYSRPWIIIAPGVTLLSGTIYHIWLAKREAVLKQYLIFLAMVLFNIVFLAVLIIDNSGSSFHFHHWNLFYLISLFTWFDDKWRISRYLHALSTGCYVETVCYWGIQYWS
jgi:hypothetical protein